MSQKNNNELPKQAAENTLNLNPVIGIRGKDLLTSARSCSRRCASRCTAPGTWRISAWS